MPVFKRPSRRVCGPRVDLAKFIGIRVDSEYERSPYPGTDIYPTQRALGPAECDCNREFEFPYDGNFTCSRCGLVKQCIYEEMPVWHGLSTKVQGSCYDCKTHLGNHLAPVTRYLDARSIEKIKAVFPLVYKTFFNIAKHRKNFCSYGFVIKKLLEMMGVDCTNIPLKIVKTKAKLRENERYWRDIRSVITIRF